MEKNAFFVMEHLNSIMYWDKRVLEFVHLKETSKRKRESFYLEFFVSAYLDNKSKIARKLGIPFTEVVFDNPNAPIIQEIVKHYKFYDENELKRIAEGFYHFYRIQKFWNDYWILNFEEQRKNIDKRFLARCALTFLTLSYPASYTSYMERNSQSAFFLFDDRVKGLGFSSISKLLECSMQFCRPGTNLSFPWDPRNQENPIFLWNQTNEHIQFGDFKEVLGNFLKSGYSMRHEDYSLLKKIQSGVLPMQYSWRRNSTNETIQDKQAINLLIHEYSKEVPQTLLPASPKSNDFSIEPEETDNPDTSDIKQKDTHPEHIKLLLETVFIIEDLLLKNVVGNSEDSNVLNEFKVELNSILNTISNLDNELSFVFLKQMIDHLEKLYLKLQEYVTKQTKKACIPDTPEIFNDTKILSTFDEERRTQAILSQLQQDDTSKALEDQDSKYSILKNQYIKQSLLLSNMIEKNKTLRNQLQESVSINSTKKALSKYFSVASLDRLIEYLKKNG